MMMRRRRHRVGSRGRIPTPIYIGEQPIAETFTPQPGGDKPLIILELGEMEAFRLVDLEGLTQEEAGEQMGVSRGTVWRLLQQARKKTAQALAEGRSIRISIE